jgi:putative SOS response-associated peptidase YedK
MCNLYRLNKPAADIAHLFGVEATQGANYSEEVYPGYPGLVMAGRRLKVMNWGFPLVMTGRNGQKLKPKPVTNARDDKLSTAFWRASFESRRCLIPVSAWAEPEGEAGQMTRTWYSLPGGEPLRWLVYGGRRRNGAMPTPWSWSKARPRCARSMTVCR